MQHEAAVLGDALHLAQAPSLAQHADCRPPVANALLTKVALTLDSALITQVDELVERRRFRNRSLAVEAALADKLQRLARTRLARESAKLNPREEKRLADEGLAGDLTTWPEY